ncbi:MAG TPA: acyltransferase family protein, partial [Acidimicrobiales bacterium]|nr:acyltransferase family protein [Acidimicrobiales bacterium]
LVWPLALLAAAALVPKIRQAEAVLALAVGGSLLSLWWRLQLWDVDEPRWSAARLYNGTDAVADQLLVGAALAAGLAIWDRRAAARRAQHPRPASEGRSFGWVGAVAAPVALGYLVFVARVHPGGDSLANDRRYLEWGSLTFALAAAVIVLACVRAGDRWLPRLLSAPPLVAVGKVSYGLYLWHFPVILVVDEQLPDASTPARATAVLVGTAVCTVASWVLVERPFLALKDGPRTAVPAPPPAQEPVESTRT